MTESSEIKRVEPENEPFTSPVQRPRVRVDLDIYPCPSASIRGSIPLFSAGRFQKNHHLSSLQQVDGKTFAYFKASCVNNFLAFGPEYGKMKGRLDDSSNPLWEFSK